MAERFDYDGDELVKQMISPADLAVLPEEYAARHAHDWLCFSYHRYRYRDAELGAWVRRVGEILFNDDELERCRQQFLSPAELQDVRRHQTADF